MFAFFFFCFFFLGPKVQQKVVCSHLNVSWFVCDICWINSFQQENCLTEANKEIKSLRANLKFGEKQREESQVAAEQMANYWQQHCESLKEENEKLLGKFSALIFNSWKCCSAKCPFCFSVWLRPLFCSLLVTGVLYLSTVFGFYLETV